MLCCEATRSTDLQVKFTLYAGFRLRVLNEASCAYGTLPLRGSATQRGSYFVLKKGQVVTKPNDVAIQALIDDTKNNIQFLLVRSDNPEIQIANAGLLFAVIAKAPRSWWWQGGAINDRLFC